MLKAMKNCRGFTKKVLVLEYNPLINGQRLSEFMGWNNPISLLEGFISDLYHYSNQNILYSVEAHIVINDFLPSLSTNNWVGTKEYLMQLSRQDFTDIVIDWDCILNGYLELEIDEVWIFSYPHSCVPQIQNIDNKWIMGFTMSNDISDMLDIYGKRLCASLTNSFDRDVLYSYEKFIKKYGTPTILPSKNREGTLFISDLRIHINWWLSKLPEKFWHRIVNQ